MTVHVGDRIVLAHEPDRAHRRHGTVREVLGTPESPEYRVVWDDGHESFIYPGPEAIVLPAGTGETEDTAGPGDTADLEDAARVPRARSGRGENAVPVGRHDPVERIMRSPVRTVDAASTLRSAAELLAEADVGALVVNRNGVPAGILSERDIVRAVAGGGDPDEVWSADVVGVDADDIVWARPSDPILQVAELMRRHHVRHVPLRARARPGAVGIVSARDVLDVLYDDR
ncbi:CBS domain-containing protein [Actinopolymorpha cephalotaxi]|uniref:CBS domain-containing protein n=1 Tax=Actinopolymorpha cephalotaxi TaxID=504797 RepID=A0A1I2LZI0_9ACTN|nr:CBS domain-containing protein [Actinopolymorpha cephalotaxi]NYH81492.1 CBS domain-containing protein [Actinopolymorpha cephalotaxi]SFF83968.1 CBS domain-containing protein [Actinopolymorpha cephalotaxi]